MPLPAPNLDDRRFQDLVDDAKRMVQQRCPEWTDHNVSDPGVTLIETVAYMLDTVLYRLNRVPDRLYLKFLDLIGVHLHPPTAARADITFWLASSADEVRTVPAETKVATPRTESEEAIPFVTVEDLSIIPCRRQRVVVQKVDDEPQDVTPTIDDRRHVDGFSSPPLPGDTVFIGLDEAVPRAAVAVRIDCEIDGVGVDPENPPLRWEAWTGTSWTRCDVDRDETGGLNRAGDVVLHIPEGHKPSVVADHRAGWLRCIVTEPEEGQPFYSDPPRIRDVSAFTIGGTTEAVNAERITEEVVGTSDGVPGQVFDLLHRPVVPSEEPVVVEVSDGDGWQGWETVDGFADSTATDPHVQLDASLGQVAFGPALREPDGDLRFHGAVPAKGAIVRVRSYRTGGGRRGNVARGALSVLKSSLPGVTRVENRAPAHGGVDGETIEGAKARGPIALRTRNRAVTVEDFEHLARECSPEVARVRAVAASDDAPGVVRVLVVPAVGDADDRGSLRFEHLVPSDEVLEATSAYLDERRCLGARVVVEPPTYQGITVVARVRPRPRVDGARLKTAAVTALNRYFHPLSGGPDGDGWPFGRPILVGEVYAVLQGVTGTELVEEVRLYAADPLTGTRGEQVTRIDPGPHALVFSYQHQVQVLEG
jgi:predicted phage baseplate assembly protein